MDVVIYLDEGLSGVHELTTPKFASTCLQDAGFTYDFVDPESLASKAARAVKGRLFGDGPAYRALVIDNQTTMPEDTADAIVKAARGGVTVVVVGDPPSKTPGLKDAAKQDAAVAKDMARLLSLKNVVQVASADDVATALGSLGTTPSASFGDPSPLLTVHRAANHDEDIWWVFNPTGSDVTATGRFATAGVPYQLDLWNGTTQLSGNWRVSHGQVEMPITLPAHATTAFTFKRQCAPLHVTATDAQEALYRGHDLVVRDTRGGTRWVTLSRGKTVRVDLGTVPAPIAVDAWHLDVDETSPTGHTAHSIDLTGLQDWRDIPELQSAVGTSTYTATVNVAAELLTADRDVLLDVGTVAGAMQVSVNGALVTNQTTPGGRWSVKTLLHAGDNTISVRLDTSLLNRMAQIQPFSFMIIFHQFLLPQASGLIGPVQLIPAATARVN